MKTRIISVVSLVVIIALISTAVYLIITNGEGAPDGDGPYVLEVIDGDTFKMSDGSKIRLLCVDTPELGEEGADRATDFLESLVLNRVVELKKGESLDEVDKYDRDLRFVYVQNRDTDVFVNSEIVRLGFGELFPYNDAEGECAEKIN